MPNVILEAMGAGKTLIATRIASMPEQVVDGETGVLVEPSDVKGLAATIARLVADPEVCSVMVHACRARFEKRFNRSASVTRYTELYDTLLDWSAGA